MQRTGRGSRERETEEKWLQRRLFSRILTQAAQKRQSDLVLWISEENFRSLISFSEPRVKLLGYTHTYHCMVELFSISQRETTWAHLFVWHLQRDTGDLVETPVGVVAWRDLAKTLHLLLCVQSTLAQCSYRQYFVYVSNVITNLHVAVQVSRTRYVSRSSVRLGRRPLTVIERMSNVGLMKPVTVSWRFALTWKSLIGNDTNPNESVSFAEAGVTPIQCMPRSLPGNSYIPLTQSHCRRLIRTFWQQVFVHP